MVFIASCFLNVFLSLLTTRWVGQQAAIYLTLCFNFKELIISIFWWLRWFTLNCIETLGLILKRKEAVSLIKIIVGREPKVKNRFLFSFLKKALAVWQFNKCAAVGVGTPHLKPCLHRAVDLASLSQTTYKVSSYIYMQIRKRYLYYYLYVYINICYIPM